MPLAEYLIKFDEVELLSSHNRFSDDEDCKSKQAWQISIKTCQITDFIPLNKVLLNSYFLFDGIIIKLVLQQPILILSWLKLHWWDEGKKSYLSAKNQNHSNIWEESPYLASGNIRH